MLYYIAWGFAVTVSPPRWCALTGRVPHLGREQGCAAHTAPPGDEVGKWGWVCGLRCGESPALLPPHLVRKGLGLHLWGSARSCGRGEGAHPLMGWAGPGWAPGRSPCLLPSTLARLSLRRRRLWSLQRLLPRAGVARGSLLNVHSSPPSLLVLTSATWSLSRAEVMLTLAETDFHIFRAVIGPLQCAQQLLGTVIAAHWNLSRLHKHNCGALRSFFHFPSPPLFVLFPHIR